jgi:hypothetical protein
MTEQQKTEQEVLKEFVDDLMAAYADYMREERELDFYVKAAKND